MKIALAQINPLMGNIHYNQKKIKKYLLQAKKGGAELVVFPELALTAYSPLDLLNRNFFLNQISRSITALKNQMPEKIKLIFGTPAWIKKDTSKIVGNCILVLEKKQEPLVFSKEILADYDVFDEKRYFQAGNLKDNVFSHKKKRIQILICEEMWKAREKRLHPMFLILSLNASPFEFKKENTRFNLARQWVKKYKCPFIYANLVGGQEELIFDGGSFVLNERGDLIHQSPSFEENLHFIDLKKQNREKKKMREKKKRQQTPFNQTKKAIIFGIKEFASKNGFQKAHLGLSGGVDSALVAYLAFRALGKENIELLFLPGPFTSRLSWKGTKEIAKKLKKNLYIYNISSLYQNILKTWKADSFPSSDVARQNLQSRLRNLYLMTYANTHPDSLLLGTANKSELSLGYATLYGDLTGALLPIGDLFKEEVYKMAYDFKNPSIPLEILKRKPSAELKENQTDEQDLPSYKILDPVLKKLLEQQKDPKTLLEKKIFHWILNAEFKRRQSPPVLKIKNHSFDRGFRLPLSMKKKGENKVSLIT